MDTDYNDGLWHGWSKETCPVNPKSIVDVVWDVGKRSANRDTRPADQFYWADNIIAFRVVKQYREPRDLWHLLDSHGQVMDTFTDEGKARAATRLLGCTSIVHYREVMEDEA